MPSWNVVERLENRSLKITNSDSVPEGYGICSSCSRIGYTSTQYGTEYVWCRMDAERQDKFHRRITKADPITNCTEYIQRGALSLNQMYDMATLIDVKKEPIGFVGGEKTIVTITPPKSDKELENSE